MHLSEIYIYMSDRNAKQKVQILFFVLLLNVFSY